MRAGIFALLKKNWKVVLFTAIFLLILDTGGGIFVGSAIIGCMTGQYGAPNVRGFGSAGGGAGGTPYQGEPGGSGNVKKDCIDKINSKASQYVDLVNKYGNKYGMDPALMLAQIEQESGFKPNAVSSAGAMGLTQFMPGTWREEGIDANGNGKADPYEPEDAIASQARYMVKIKTQWLNKNLQTWPNALAGYNAGAGAVNKYGGVPPYKETQGYVKNIMTNYNKYKDCLEKQKNN